MFDGTFHTYGARITTDWITIFYDGKELSRFPMSEFFRTPLYMVVTLAMNPSEVAQASGRYDMVLDYVRAYSAPAAMERHLNGTDAANILTGGHFDDVLDGRGGADKMSGGLGNDTYKVDNASDAVIEVKDAGIDWVVSSVTYSLSGQQVEQLTLTGAARVNAVGNELNNVLKGNNSDNTLLGNAGNDIVLGEGGNDVLIGGSGIDRLTGGAGNDSFVFNTAPNTSTNFDRITDFNPAYDTIRIENAVMPGLGSQIGTLAPGAFRQNPSGLAEGKSERIIYETDTGWLNYDANGSVAGGAVHIAQLTIDLPLTRADFMVI
jgi:Ca2+-binding RTX toxin-like protein